MDKQLIKQAFGKFFAGVLLVGLLLFLPAGTLRWQSGWLLCAVLFVPMFFGGLVMMKKAPDLLRKRLDAKEKLGAQKAVIGLSGLMFLAGFLLAGFDRRFGWTTVPGWLALLSAALFLLGYALFAEVLRENAWLSRTVEVQQGQQVVDTGMYGLVRHPMYTATLLMFLSMPLILGSWVSFVVFLAYPPIIVKRLKGEEILLKEELFGYETYCEKVKYRLIPYIY
ncbi:MAG: isoprenylcysteine carboxylmethyltransferase family protein [Clostridia bacterium]|nr:isoprenylcysteine carboxylmethyltransferase family protein [Clostridia bacterium]